MKPWYLSRTIWLNVISLVLLLINHRMEIVTDPVLLGHLSAAALVLNAVLRFLTGQPIGRPDQEAGQPIGRPDQGDSS